MLKRKWVIRALEKTALWLLARAALPLNELPPVGKALRGHHLIHFGNDRIGYVQRIEVTTIQARVLPPGWSPDEIESTDEVQADD